MNAYDENCDGKTLSANFKFDTFNYLIIIHFLI